ncbi:hypothetical protein SASPL_122435 [Salvia splendens]|uniref:RING-type domain-containing protein n=1 Tax=Salvia splendens TaxID=180675 RepID=A0A8X8ZSZ5_SALSN|nr:hypothetical protein SASPL_122435 [Salvia splendens]
MSPGGWKSEFLNWKKVSGGFQSDRTIVHGPSSGTLQRHVRYSPSWSFRWDNRGRVAGEETHANWLHDGDKSHVSDGNAGLWKGVLPLLRHHQRVHNNRPSLLFTSILNKLHTVHWTHEKSINCFLDPLLLYLRHLQIVFLTDEAISRNLVEVKDSAESRSVSHPSPVKLSPLSTSATSPVISQIQFLRPDSTPSRCHRYSRGPQFLHQAPASKIPEDKSPPFSISEETSSRPPPDWGSESARVSNGRSSDSWSIPVVSELMATRRERWSFDSENSHFSVDKTATSSGSPHTDLQTCGVCAKLLTMRSSWEWASQKIVSSNELAVVSILTCGHVYHAECLEHMTPEINKYDPACLVCTYGEKQAVKMSEKALKAELDLKHRKRRSKKHADGSDWRAEAKGSKLGSSIINKSSPFLKRHLSFGSKSGKLLQENHQLARRKPFFWARSSKE